MFTIKTNHRNRFFLVFLGFIFLVSSRIAFAINQKDYFTQSFDLMNSDHLLLAKKDKNKYDDNDDNDDNDGNACDDGDDGDGNGACNTTSNNNSSNNNKEKKVSQTNLWDISNEPLFLAKSADPLITILWDDSGSMLLETSPERSDYVNMAFPASFSSSTYYATARFGNRTNSKKVRDPKQNALFFDPFKEYKPWVKADGTYFEDANYTSLYKTPNKVHPDDELIQSSGSCKTTDLTEQYKPCYKYTFCDNSSRCWNNRSNKYWPGDFFYDGKRYNLKDKNKNYSTSWFYSGSPSISADNILAKAANWYTFYRDRKNVAKAALGYTLQDIPNNVQIGFTTFTHAKDNPSQPLLFQHKKFDDSNKQELYDTIYNENRAGSTPLREALLNVNRYIKNNDDLWFDGDSALSCRRAYNIIISDGNWSDGSIDFNANSDGTLGPEITSSNGQTYQYNPDASGSYKDNYGGTLADVAMEFWKKDIRPDIDNTLYVSSEHKNPAFWQHIVTHSISLNDDIGEDIPNSWPNVLSGYNSIERYKDLWHASLNTKGGYLHSTDFDSLKSALSQFLYDASSLTATVGFINTGIINSTYELSSNSKLFKTFMNPITWSGDVKGFNLDSNGNILSGDNNAHWSASENLPSPNNRNILAMYKKGSSSATTPFKWSELPESIQQTIGSEDIVNYYRGDRSKEGYQYTDGTQGLRLRSNPIGDIINAKPIHVAGPAYDYSYDNYANFKSQKANRPAVVYTASNSGFLHAFNASNGEELFAIANQNSINKLNARAQSGYNHTYALDGTPKAGDAYFGGSWNTILVTPYAAGGQGVFSINITDPNNITESNASNLNSNGFWQFDDSNDPDLGYTFASPVITRINSSNTNSSTWGVLLGNGYNNNESDDNASTSGNAVLFVLNAADGSVIKKLDTGLGKSGDPEGNNRANGLSSPTVIDYTGDGVADYVYAGDIFGNIWKFDVKDPSPANWTVTKLFNNDSNEVQSITSAPDVKKHPSGNGVIVYAATGRFMGATDISKSQSNSIYAVYDNMTDTAIDRTQLVAQNIADNISSNGRNNRIMSNNDVDWSQKFGWYIDLPSNELVLNRPKLSQGYLLLASYIPDQNNNVCTNNQKGYLYALNPLTGGALTSNIIDTNSDGALNENDTVSGSQISGIELQTKFNSEPVIMKKDNNYNLIMLNTQEGDIVPVTAKRNYTAPVRRSWKKVKGPDAERSVIDN